MTPSTLRALGLRVDRTALEAPIVHATKCKLGLTEFVEQLCALERRERDAKSLAQRMKTATLGAFITLDRFDWNHPRTVDRGLYEMLIDSLDWIRRGGKRLAPRPRRRRHHSSPCVLRRLERVGREEAATRSLNAF